MSTYLICSTPIHGNVSPMTVIGKHLASLGHRVVMLTGSRFAERVTDAGMEFRALTGAADFDDRDVDSYLPDRERFRGLARAQYEIQTIFVKTIPAQYAQVVALIDEVKPDAVLVDSTFAGVAPLLLDPNAKRPPILGFGVSPLSQASADVAPYGMGLAPMAGPAGRIRNRVLNFVAHKVLFRPTQKVGERMFADAGALPLKQFIMDLSECFDRYLQLNTSRFEYPRSDLSPNAVFMGPLPSAPSSTPLPDWWADLDGSRKVVHVSQGTIDNRDLSRLIRPTIEALAASDVLVVVSMGGGDAATLGPVPSNVRVADYLPYDHLLPLVDVFVTNGGFGGVQHALREGVPIVIAGDTEEKPEVAARVAWSGVGVNLRTGSPTADVVRTAVETVLADGSYLAAAREQAALIAQLAPLEAIEREVAAAVVVRRA